MITKEEFIKFITAYQEFSESVDRFDMAITGKSYSTILFETDWFDAVGRMLDIFLDSHFTEEGQDWICYCLWEDAEDKAAYIIKDKDMFNEERKVRFPLDTLDELWEFLQSDVKLYFKNV